MKINLNNRRKFQERHIGPNDEQAEQMLKQIGVGSLEELLSQTIPSDIRLKRPLDLPEPKSEYVFLNELRKLAAKNKVFNSCIGQGYYNTITPNVIRRNILENPGWYTAYTPYQAEVAQGRLEMLLNFQTLVSDLTGMEISTASLLDEATAAAEAMAMLFAVRKNKGHVFLVSEHCLPQTIEVLKTRANPLRVEIRVAEITEKSFSEEIFGCLFQYPDARGVVRDLRPFLSAAKEKETLTVIAADILSLSILTSPGELGADVAVGSAQRFGVPMGFGGPHAAYFSTRETYKRHLPGRIIGVSVDAEGYRAYRMALQTREQHIRREKATSNICTSQVLLAVMSAAFAIYHGPKGIRGIGERVHGIALLLSRGLEKLGFKQQNTFFFDTIRIHTQELTTKIRTIAEARFYNFYYEEDYIQIAVDETTQLYHIQEILAVFSEVLNQTEPRLQDDVVEMDLPEEYLRKSPYLAHPVFNAYHSEHEMLRYLKKLENKDLSLVHSMIALGSCTMKLNATTEMLPVTWPEFASIHPLAPASQVGGYLEMIDQLKSWLAEITGFKAVSLQPNSGAQGEYTGLLTIREFYKSRGEQKRKTALIPSSAHGTNPASAVMADFQVVVVKCDEKGNIDLADLSLKAEKHKDTLGVLMITYPSTHGVFEEKVKEICTIVHEMGGQVYMDGANMNAQVGLTSPGAIGADVCHLNLHKTFCIPHGGGGPGMGPIAVAEHLEAFLPGHIFMQQENTYSVSAAPFGSASILPISYAYISMMGASGLREATEAAILNANYLMSRLKNYYPVLYSGVHNLCAHEFILDCRAFKRTAGVEVEDIAKRLMDYGFHAPTVSFPVPGTLMIEPTESESLAELDRFCEAMISIREEIEEIETGRAGKTDNVLKNAPHTARVVLSERWNKPYSREKAVYPLEWISEQKFWPSVARIDNAYGDRNLVCACPPIEMYEQHPEVI